MGLQAILFDLDDTLLWDEKSVDIALANTCGYAAEKAGVDEAKLQEDVRKIAPEMYASYETYGFAKKIGIGVFEAMWANFDDPGEDFAKLRETAMHYRVDVWKKALEIQGCEKSGLAEKLSRVFGEERRANPFLFSTPSRCLTH
ncbi:hypothetical protein P5G51_014200 [Virgibacillus sp. 179-BFC.A HS]|uniref:Hydrolase of the HAD superfamily n=1 Tax=Tigheibacillus jepli TaxID=3035914 RepID=A0ABU5CJ92_9BACI|nr:hypothetical protein [Virgibacillus sp. 179-BFC.A HS]MDY0406389.1 hypothetical protein [Virgibacillus sp. 179-BFC.A HS]